MAALIPAFHKLVLDHQRVYNVILPRDLRIGHMAQFSMSPCEKAQSHVRNDALHMPPDCMNTSGNHVYLDQVAIVRAGRQ